MRALDLIMKKRNGLILTAEEIQFLIENYVRGEIPDYQMSAFCMAVYFQGMSKEETSAFTLAMAGSGDTVDLSSIPGIKVDKHSTGGVADTTTLVLAPLLAAAGVSVAKMSGRGLGHTGGTIDKLESIPGFKTTLDKERFISQVREIGLAVVGQSGNLVPADKKLYALRDVTGTVDSIPLIASSIMSKKIAAGAQAIILDVKTGSGAFMKNKEEAYCLAQAMVEIGQEVGRQTAAVISDMNEPLGSAVGNALEVEEAIWVLQGKVKGPLRDLTILVGAQLLKMTGRAASPEEAVKPLNTLLDDGSALAKFTQMIEAQGGNPAVTQDTSLLPQAAFRCEVLCPQEGYLLIENTQALGRAAMLLGAGRETKDAAVDLAVGFKLHGRTGDKFVQGQPLATMYYNNKEKLEEALKVIHSSWKISSEKVERRPLIYGIATTEGLFHASALLDKVIDGNKDKCDE